MEELTATTLEIIIPPGERIHRRRDEVGDAVHTAVGMLPGLRRASRVVLTGWTIHAVYRQQFRSTCAAAAARQPKV